MSNKDPRKTIKDTIIKYKDIIFVVDSTICTTCLDELKNQQVIDDKTYNQKLKDDAVRKIVWNELQNQLP